MKTLKYLFETSPAKLGRYLIKAADDKSKAHGNYERANATVGQAARTKKEPYFRAMNLSSKREGKRTKGIALAVRAMMRKIAS